MYYLITGANGRYRLRGSEYTGGRNRTHAQTEENENRGKTKTEKSGGCNMEFQLGQHIKMKKTHPCGKNDWEILRVGMDFRLKCSGCGHMIMIPRKDVEKNFRGFIS